MTDTYESFSTSFTTQKSPHEVFQAVTNVAGWWSEDIRGNSAKLNDEFIFEVAGVHFSRQKLIEVIPDKKVVWHITEADMSFIKQRDEWVGTKVMFDISTEGADTLLTFTHQGLVPQVECYKACMPAWTEYIQHSLKQLVETGTGDPNLEGRSINEPTKIGESV